MKRFFEFKRYIDVSDSGEELVENKIVESESAMEILKLYALNSGNAEEEYNGNSDGIKFHRKEDYIEGNDNNAIMFLKDVNSYGNSGYITVNVIGKSIEEMRNFVNESIKSELELIKAYIALT